MADHISTSQLVLERHLDAPIERVWQFIVDPDLRARWFMAAPDDLRPEGTIGFTMDHDRLSDQSVPTPLQYRAFVGQSWTERILAFEPPRRILFTWENGEAGEVEIRLFADDEGTRLVLTHSRLRGREDVLNFGGGWHSHLAALTLRISGEGVPNFWALVSDGQRAMMSALDSRLKVTPGRNIAIKVPLHRWDETVAFYRDRVGLEVVRELEASIGFRFGDMTLWIDCVPHQSQVDVWLELFSDDPAGAIAALASPRRDELEPLDDVAGHWTSDPAGTVLLVRRPAD